MSSLIGTVRLVDCYKNFFNYTKCKRFAGHSKWSNIKHIKAEKDGQKQAAMLQLMKQIKIAVAEGKSAKPEDNLKLAKIIDNAKKKSLPLTNIKSYLEKVQSSKFSTESVLIESRGPAGSVVLIHLLTDNFVPVRNNINTMLKKSFFKQSERTTNKIFDKKGIILTEAEGMTLDIATDDAIEAGAEEAEKIEHEGNQFFQFTCNPNDLHNVKTALEEKNYKIIEADIEYVPKVCISLNDADEEKLNKLYERLKTIDDVYKIYNNVA